MLYQITRIGVLAALGVGVAACEPGGDESAAASRFRPVGIRQPARPSTPVASKPARDRGFELESARDFEPPPSFDTAIDPNDPALRAAKAAGARAQLRRVRSALEIHYVENGAWPQDLSTLVRDGTLDRSDVLDPWQRPIRLAERSGRPVLSSNGPDGLPGNQDDIVVD